MGTEPIDRHRPGGHDDDAVFAAIMAWLETGARSELLDSEEARDGARFSTRVTLARALRQRLAEAALPALPAAARARALGLAARADGTPSEALSRATEAIGRAWRTLRARLVPEDPEFAPAFRSGNPSVSQSGRPDGRTGPFLALYSAEGYDIDVSLSERGTLIGQILPLAGAAPFDGGRCTVVPLDGRGAPRSITIGADGEFIVEGPHATAIELVLEREFGPAGPVRIIIDRIDLSGDTGNSPPGEPAP